MAIIGFDPDEIIPYVPEYGGNRTSDRPCVVHIRFVSHAKIESYRLNVLRGLPDTASAEARRERLSKVQRRQFIENVASIDGYFVDHGNREVTDPAEFYDRIAPEKLVTEIILAMEDQQKLSEGQEKNFERASGGTSLSQGRPEAPLTVINAPKE